MNNPIIKFLISLTMTTCIILGAYSLAKFIAEDVGKNLIENNTAIIDDNGVIYTMKDLDYCAEQITILKNLQKND